MGYKLILSLSVFILLCYCEGSLAQYLEVKEANTSGVYVYVLRGRDGNQGRGGRQGRDGPQGRDGASGGLRGERGTDGGQGPPGFLSGGVTYIRWGKSSCPGVTGTEVLYTGFAGGSFFNEDGGSITHLCLPEVPEYSSNLTYRDGIQSHAIVHGAEYENPLQGSSSFNVPCALCHAATRPTLVMIPAKASCPATWTMEYYGYLMTAARNHKRSTFECVDKSLESIPNSQADNNGALFYHTEARCGTGLSCPNLYNDNLEINCVVCTK